MRISDKWSEFIRKFPLNRRIKTPAGSPVRVNEFLLAVRGREFRSVAHNVFSERYKIFFRMTCEFFHICIITKIMKPAIFGLEGTLTLRG